MLSIYIYKNDTNKMIKHGTFKSQTDFGKCSFDNTPFHLQHVASSNNETGTEMLLPTVSSPEVITFHY